jgi:primosomal protein N' (replication factor Y)
MVPEINLTPQLEERFVGRFAPRFGAGAVVSLHSGMTNPQRLKSWLAAHSGSARIVLGTRMAVFASLPGLQLVVVDEEHDPSYKQQEGARYSARDLAIWRGREQGAKVLLGSATPSLESWHASRPPTPEDPEGGRYVRLHMPSRIGAGALARGAPRGHEPAAPSHRVQRAAAAGHHRARGAWRAKHDLAEPPRLCPRAALRGLRLEKRLPPLQRAPGLSQDRPHPALPPLRVRGARAPPLPQLRQPRHPPHGPGHRAARRATGRPAAQRAAARWHPARIARIDADTTKAKGALEASWRRCIRARWMCWWARR